ncbi:hypothetical protein LQZ18_06460 [Lachnospiraceae bacterium ZAX-1]
MNTKPIPAVIMMIAGIITCLMAVFNHMELAAFLKTLLIVLVGFYMLGCVIKLVLDFNFPKIMEEPETESEIKTEPELDENGEPIEMQTAEAGSLEAQAEE